MGWLWWIRSSLLVVTIGQHGEACQCGDLSNDANSQATRLDIYLSLPIETLVESPKSSEVTARVGHLQPRKEMLVGRSHGYTTGEDHTSTIPLHVTV